VLEKGRRNVEILKQAQYSPLTVEKQVAIIFCGTRGLLRRVPLNSIKDFEVEFLHFLEVNHNNVLKNLQAGKLLDEDVKTLEKVAREIGAKYEKK
jgi:F-type H+-transporting ATPase subunit alpha